MTATTRTVLIAMTAGMVLLAAGAAASLIEFDRAGLIGAGIGLALGLLNLVVGYRMTLRAVNLGLNPALRIMLGGFFVRLLVLGGLTLAFQRTEAIDEVAFALVFLLFFFVLLAIEIVVVEKTLQGRSREGKGRPA